MGILTVFSYTKGSIYILTRYQKTSCITFSFSMEKVKGRGQLHHIKPFIQKT